MSIAEPDSEETLPTIRAVIERYDLRSQRALGQNFLRDLNLTARIVRTAGDLTGTTVIEVGPGPGALTRSILAAGPQRLFAIEKDPRCVAALGELSQVYGDRLTIIEGDALALDPGTLGTRPRRIIANLPYNVATPLLIGWLKRISTIDGLTLMFQKEVADRLIAPPGTKTYGRLSVVTQWLCEARREFDIPGRAFTPPAKVTSTVVSLVPRATPLAPAAWQWLEKVAAAGFGQRRKMLRASLKPLGLNLESLGIDGSRRAEQLTVQEFCTIARAAAEKA